MCDVRLGCRSAGQWMLGVIALNSKDSVVSVRFGLLLLRHLVFLSAWSVVQGAKEQTTVSSFGDQHGTFLQGMIGKPKGS